MWVPEPPTKVPPTSTTRLWVPVTPEPKLIVEPLQVNVEVSADALPSPIVVAPVTVSCCPKAWVFNSPAVIVRFPLIAVVVCKVATQLAWLIVTFLKLPLDPFKSNLVAAGVVIWISVSVPEIIPLFLKA